MHSSNGKIGKNKYNIITAGGEVYGCSNLRVWMQQLEGVVAAIRGCGSGQKRYEFRQTLSIYNIFKLIKFQQ